MEEREAAERAAVAAAEAWLELVDAGDTAASWERAAALFRRSVTQQQWQVALEAVQEPLGRAVSRRLESARYVRELPGAPDGEYVVLEYATAFENKRNGVETVTPMRDDDGEWRVSGYYVK